MKTDELLRKKWCVCLLAMVCCALWGSAHPGIKIGYKLFAIGAEETMVQILFAGCRFFLGGILAVFLGSLLNRKIFLPKKASMGKIWKLAMVQTVAQYLFFYVGLAHTTGVKSSIINGCNVFMSIFIAAVFFKQEKITKRKMLGCLVGFAGVVLVNVVGSSGFDLQMKLNGEGALLVSNTVNGLAAVMLKRYSAEEDPVVLNGYQFILGGLVMIMVGIASGARIAPAGAALPAIAMLLYLGFVSAVAYSLWALLLKYNPVSGVTIFGFMTPLFGVVLSALLLGETGALGITGITALILVSVGIYVVNKERA